MADAQELVERLLADLEQIQERDRPLPWVVHSGSSYRRIASEPTREGGYRTFPDGNVLHAYNQRSDNHPDLSMDEDQLCALIRIVNSVPEAADTITTLTTRLAAVETREARLREALGKCAHWVEWCVHHHDAPDTSCEEAALKIARTALMETSHEG